MSRVLIAMSGGVDSSAAAALLQDGGHEVAGATMRLRPDADGPSRDARRVADLLGIPWIEIDLAPAFEAEVVSPFVAAYGAGETPNPCVTCNRRIKFGRLLGEAVARGFDFLATGHYARLGGAPGGRYLRAAADPSRDQSYFLARVPPEALERVLFPLGEMTKGEVRRLAKARGLPVAEKADSQEVCFIPEGDAAAFVGARLAIGAGEIVDGAGRVLGRHRGLHAYTVGQRRGLGIAAPEPLYVTRIDARANRLVVGPRAEAMRRGFAGEEAVWGGGFAPEPRFRATVKIRSTARAVPCEVELAGEGRVRVGFDTPQFAAAPGQTAVFYETSGEGERVLGATRIARDGEGGT